MSEEVCLDLPRQGGRSGLAGLYAARCRDRRDIMMGGKEEEEVEELDAVIHGLGDAESIVRDPAPCDGARALGCFPVGWVHPRLVPDIF